MKKTILLLIIPLYFSIHNSINGQNLVLNPSFEQVDNDFPCTYLYTTNLSTHNGIMNDYYHKIYGWRYPMKKNLCGHPGTSDVYCPTFPAENRTGTKQGHTGNYEFLVGELTAPMSKGEKYYIEYYVRANTSNPPNSGLLFTVGTPTQCGNENNLEGNPSPQIPIPSGLSLNTNEWKKVSQVFTADKSYDRVVLGVFVGFGGDTYRIWWEDILVKKHVDELAGTTTGTGSGTTTDYCYRNKPVVGNFNGDYKEYTPTTTQVPANSGNAGRRSKTLKRNEPTIDKGPSKDQVHHAQAYIKKYPYDDIIYFGLCGQSENCWRGHINNQNGKFNLDNYGDGMWFAGNKPIHAPIAGDFNGDGYTDITYFGLWGPSENSWRTHINNKNGELIGVNYGAGMWFAGDKPIHAPMAGDFNGDGYTDIAYFGLWGPDSENAWRVHLNNKNGGFTGANFGAGMWFAGDKPIHAPIAGDFNADGYTDIAYFGLYGQSENCWRVHINNKNGGFTGANYGAGMWFAGDKPIHAPFAGDFNGDGYTDIAYFGLWGPDSENAWRVHINNKNGGFTGVNYGAGMWFAGDQPIHAPVAGDFNGDGYTDIAYFGLCGGNSENCWRVHINNKNGGFTGADYGAGMWFHNCE